MPSQPFSPPRTDPELGLLAGRLLDDAYLAASAAAGDLVRAWAVEILSRLGLWELPPLPLAAPELAARLGVAPERLHALHWILAAAAPDVSTVDDAEAAPRFGARGRRPPDLLSAARQRCLSERSRVGCTLEMVEHVGGAYPEFLRGARSGAAILLKGAGLALWEAYFTAANPLHQVHNDLAAAGVRAALRRLSRPARVLELGTGTGGGAATILAELRAAEVLGSVATFTVSDISPSFLVRVVERLRDAGVEIRRKRLDFDRPLAEQDVEPESLDVMVGVNALHNCHDLAAGLRRLGAALSPEGCLVVSESICGDGRQVHQDFIFNLLPAGPAGFGEPRWPPRSRFLPAAGWRRALAAAGLAFESWRNPQGPELAVLALAGRWLEEAGDLPDGSDFQ